MAPAVQKITLSASRDIPFNKLVLSQSNVRRLKAGVSIEELAEDIARRGLLQSLNVRPVLDADGTETGVFEIPAGGRRYRALELLVKAKRLNKTAPVPCVVRETGTEISAEEDSLAENAHRAALQRHGLRPRTNGNPHAVHCARIDQRSPTAAMINCAPFRREGRLSARYQALAGPFRRSP